jgi:hypothetical protein
MAKLDLLEEIERKADGYLVINTLLNISLQIASIYGGIYLSTYIWRLLSCPC